MKAPHNHVAHRTESRRRWMSTNTKLLFYGYAVPVALIVASFGVLVFVARLGLGLPGRAGEAIELLGAISLLFGPIVISVLLLRTVRCSRCGFRQWSALVSVRVRRSCHHTSLWWTRQCFKCGADFRNDR